MNYPSIFLKRCMQWNMLLMLLACTQAWADKPFIVSTLVSGLEHPWGMAFLPDGQILVTERPGRLRLIENNRLHSNPISGLPNIAAVGQGGCWILFCTLTIARMAGSIFLIARQGQMVLVLRLHAPN